MALEQLHGPVGVAGLREVPGQIRRAYRVPVRQRQQQGLGLIQLSDLAKALSVPVSVLPVRVQAFGPLAVVAPAAGGDAPEVLDAGGGGELL